MDGIPVLEIDCNMEFHDDEAMKKKMLDQVITHVKIILCRRAVLIS